MKLKLILYLWIINIIGGSTINHRIRKLLANNLVYFRHKNKLFQEALAEKMKSSSFYISQIENVRRNITNDFIDKIYYLISFTSLLPTKKSKDTLKY